MSPILSDEQVRKLLSSAGYAYDTIRGVWTQKGAETEREDVLVFLIRHARSHKYPDAGAWGEAAVDRAERLAIESNWRGKSLRVRCQDIYAALPPALYQYNPIKRRWSYDGKRVRDDDENNITAVLIRFIRGKVTFAGDWAAQARRMAENDPAYTAKVFLQSNARKERGRRVRGMDAFLQWLRIIGVSLPDCATDAERSKWVMQHGKLACRFYDALVEMGYRVRGKARIFGKKGVWSNVIEGLHFVTDKVVEKAYGYAYEDEEVVLPASFHIAAEPVLSDEERKRRDGARLYEETVRSILGKSGGKELWR